MSSRIGAISRRCRDNLMPPTKSSLFSRIAKAAVSRSDAKEVRRSLGI